MGMVRSSRTAAVAAIIGVAWSLAAPASGAADDPGVTRLNQLRAVAGVPPVSADPWLAADAALHSRYQAENGVITHAEDPDNPWFTEAGDRAGRHSNVSVRWGGSLGVAEAVDVLTVAPFHGVGQLDPRLTSSGSAIDTAGTTTAFTIDVLSARSATPPAVTWPVVFPGRGAVSPLAAYTGGERPDPLTPCSGYTPPTGAPLIVQLATPDRLASASLTGPAGLEPVCAYDAQGYVNPDPDTRALGSSVMLARNAIFVIPRSPLGDGAYTATVADTSGATTTWSFSIRAGGSPAAAGSVDTAENPGADPCADCTAPSAAAGRRFSGWTVPEWSDDTDHDFTDVGTGVDEAVGWLASNDISQGRDGRVFLPGEVVTRGQMAAFLWRLAGEPATDGDPGFTDVTAEWQKAPVAWLVETGITTGVGPGRFAPDREVTRGQMAAFLWRLVDRPAPSGRWFVDVVEEWQIDAVSWLAETGVTTGYDPTHFGPDRLVTRGQMAALLYRLARRLG